jgi:HlyD family type I secretion membrane fusion protein
MSGPLALRPRALADLLRQPHVDVAREREWQAQTRRLVITLALGAGLFAAWAAFAPLAGAVVAPAQVKVQTQRKTVQHQEGGIVREVLVRDGQSVHAGDPLHVIGDVRQDADLKLLQEQWRAAQVRAARADAEARLAPRFEAPQALQREPSAAEPIAHERAVFVAHRQALDEQLALLQEQARQAQAQAAALQAQIDATAASGSLSDEELAINEQLAQQGFVNRTRLIGLQRTATDYRSHLAEVHADLAVARQRVAELRVRGAQLRLAYQSQATDEAKDAAGRVRELEEKLRPSQDEVARQTVRAPVDGEVMSLHVTGAGAVIAPREALLDIVPQREKLVVEARIEPQDIDNVHVGGAAEVRLISADARRAPLLPAKVTFVSADRVTESPTGKAWYDVTVEVETESLGAEQRALHLQAGMPAELYVTTGERSLLEYLMKPLRAFSQRALREPG